MNKIEKIKNCSKKLNFELDENQINDISAQFDKIEEKISLIKNFDFDKYTKYLEPSLDEQLVISFSELRNDIDSNENNDFSLFENSVDFEDGYVVLKNEK